MDDPYNIYASKKKSRSKEKQNAQKIRGKSSIKKLFEGIKYKCISKVQKINSYKIKELENFLINEKEINILGKKFDLKNQNWSEIKCFFKNLKLFTYTKQFYYKKKIVDDIGWSCTIKTGQMLIINFLIRNLLIKKINFSEEKIINFFIGENIFGIVNFLKTGFENFGKKFQKQWNQIEFFETASKILKKNKKIIFEKNLKNFKIINSQGIINPKKIKNSLKKNKSILLIIHLQLGHKKINNYQKPHLEKLIKNKFFSGAVAGHKNSSYYIFGFFNKKFIYLDPHRIRENNKLKDFKVKNFNEINFCDLHPSVSVSFFLNNSENFEEFLKFLENFQCDLIGVEGEEESEGDIEFLDYRDFNGIKDVAEKKKENFENRKIVSEIEDFFVDKDCKSIQDLDDDKKKEDFKNLKEICENESFSFLEKDKNNSIGSLNLGLKSFNGDECEKNDVKKNNEICDYQKENSNNKINILKDFKINEKNIKDDKFEKKFDNENDFKDIKIIIDENNSKKIEIQKNVNNFDKNHKKKLNFRNKKEEINDYLKNNYSFEKNNKFINLINKKKSKKIIKNNKNEIIHNITKKSNLENLELDNKKKLQKKKKRSVEKNRKTNSIKVGIVNLNKKRTGKRKIQNSEQSNLLKYKNDKKKNSRFEKPVSFIKIDNLNKLKKKFEKFDLKKNYENKNNRKKHSEKNRLKKNLEENIFEKTFNNIEDFEKMEDIKKTKNFKNSKNNFGREKKWKKLDKKDFNKKLLNENNLNKQKKRKFNFTTKIFSKFFSVKNKNLDKINKRERKRKIQNSDDFMNISNSNY